MFLANMSHLNCEIYTDYFEYRSSNHKEINLKGCRFSLPKMPNQIKSNYGKPEIKSVRNPSPNRRKVPIDLFVHSVKNHAVNLHNSPAIQPSSGRICQHLVEKI